MSTLDLANLPRTPEGKVDFAKDFFGSEAFLTVSGQLNVEAYCLALTKVYTFGPTFRAENSNTSRHLAEFWMIEPEIAFADLSDDATLAEQLLKYIFEALLKERADDLAFFDERVEKGLVAKLEGIVGSEFVRMDYSEAIAVLEKAEGEVRVPGEMGHRPAVRARALSHREARQEAGDRDELPEGHQGVLHARQRRRQNRRGDGRAGARASARSSAAASARSGSTCSMRAWTSAHIDKEHYGWYRDLRRYGTVPHAGFGLGFERTLAYVTGLANVRDAIPFPRTPGHAKY